MLDLEDAVPPTPRPRARRWSPRPIPPSAAAAGCGSTPRARTCAPRTSTRSRRTPTASGSRRPSRPTTCVGGRPGAGPADHLRDRDGPRACWPRRRSPLRPGVAHLRMGGVDLQRDLVRRRQRPADALRAQPPRGLLAGGAELPPPIDSVYPLIDDDAGLRAEAEFVRSLGFGGKSAIHPRQMPVLHEVFAPSERELAWAREVLAAFEAAGRGATPAAGRRVRRPAGGAARAAAAGDRRPPVAAGPPGRLTPDEPPRVGTFAARVGTFARESAGERLGYASGRRGDREAGGARGRRAGR